MSTWGSFPTWGGRDTWGAEPGGPTAPTVGVMTAHRAPSASMARGTTTAPGMRGRAHGAPKMSLAVRTTTGLVNAALNSGAEDTSPLWSARAGTTVARSTLASRTGGYSWLVTATAALSATGPNPGGFLARTSGAPTEAAMYVLTPEGSTQTWRVAIDWLNSSLGYITSSAGPNVACPVGVWTYLTVTANAPSGTAWAVLRPYRNQIATVADRTFIDDAWLAASLPEAPARMTGSTAGAGYDGDLDYDAPWTYDGGHGSGATMRGHE